LRKNKLKRESGEKYSKGGVLYGFLELKSKIHPGWIRIIPGHQIWVKCIKDSCEVFRYSDFEAFRSVKKWYR
jgi:hypothetical protein